MRELLLSTLIYSQLEQQQEEITDKPDIIFSQLLWHNQF